MLLEALGLVGLMIGLVTPVLLPRLGLTLEWVVTILLDVLLGLKVVEVLTSI